MGREEHPSDFSNRRESGGATPPPPDVSEDESHHRTRWSKLLIGLGVGCLTINVLGAAFLLGTMTLGLSSCMHSCSDNPIGDSRENAAFISDRMASEHDLEVFDALRGSFEALHKQMVRWEATEGAALLPVDDLREQIAAGTWPKDEGEALSPQVWVRIAELSESWLEEQTGEGWQVMDFSYPFPDNGGMPVPVKRDESDCCVTQLLCTEGDDEGLYTTVNYYRWARDAYFAAEHLDSNRSDAVKRTELYDQIADTGLVGNRRFLIAEDNVYIWSEGEDDALRDKGSFLTMATELSELLGDYDYVVLLEPDTPVMVGYDTFSHNYPNRRSPEELSFDKARELLLRAGRARTFDHATGDILYSICRRGGDEAIDEENLTGTLSDEGSEFVRQVWRAPEEGAATDDELADLAAATLGTSQENLIVASQYDRGTNWGDGLTVWLYTPRGALPETPDAFCTAMDELRDAMWEQVPSTEKGGGRKSLYVHVFEFDDATLVDESGESCSFAQLRGRCQSDPTAIGAYKPDLLLGYMISATQWPEDEEWHPIDCSPSEVDGSIAQSRAWRYGEGGPAGLE